MHGTDSCVTNGLFFLFVFFLNVSVSRMEQILQLQHNEWDGRLKV